MSKIVTPILFFIIAIGLFFTYIRPAYDVLLAFQQQEKEIDQAIESTKELVIIHDNLMTELNNIDPKDKTRMRTILPESVDVVRLILDLDALATKHDIDIEEFEIPVLEVEQPTQNTRSRGRTNTDEQEKPYTSAILTVEFAGAYPDFKDFLIDVERSLILMDVVDMEISVPDITQPGIDADSQTTYSVGLQVYWLK